MSNVYISPCGTSLLTNNVEYNVRQLLFKTANCQESELTTEDKAIISKHIQQRTISLTQVPCRKRHPLSAAPTNCLQGRP